MKRQEMLRRIETAKTAWDVLIIGGGATGLGIAVDSAARGYATALVEQADFAKATSSRSTKLVHGGVRYLQQGNVSLVLEALHERGILYRNAPHLVRNLAFVVPAYDWWEGPFYGVGLKLYDAMAGRHGFGRSKWLSKSEAVKELPTIRTDGLRGGVRYFDGQFDDARLAIDLAQTAVDLGAVVLNYLRVTALQKSNGIVTGATARDEITGEVHEIHAKVVINATGPFSDTIRRMDDAAAAPMIKPSRGVHLILDRSFLPNDSAILVPHTSDGRVLFAVPWHDRVLVGTTDTPVAEAAIEPRASEEEIGFIIENASRYLATDPKPSDILSVFAGIRPLVDFGQGQNTAAVSRDHTIHVSPSGLLSVAGGKWTTYRKMAEDTVDQARSLGELPERPTTTRDLKIHGYLAKSAQSGDLAIYGSDANGIREIMRETPALAERIDPGLPILRAEVIWAARSEMAMTVEDFLSRRTRALLLDARRSVGMAKEVASLLAKELKRDKHWQDSQVEEYSRLAAGYLP